MEFSDPYRLVTALSVASLLLLLMEAYLGTAIMGVFGLLAFMAAVFIGLFKCSIDVGSLVLLGGTTFISLGFLLMLVYFPNSPWARKMLERGKQRRLAEELRDEESQED